MTNALRILLIYYTNITLVACAVTAHAESLQLNLETAVGRVRPQGIPSPAGT